MLTWEVSETGKFTQSGLFSLCSAASTTPHIYSAQQTSFALTPGPHLPDVTGHCHIGSYPSETVGSTRTFPRHIPAETCCYHRSASADLPSCLTRSFSARLLRSHHHFELWLGGLLCCHPSGSHNVPTAASTSRTRREGARGRGAKKYFATDVLGFLWSQVKGPAVSSKDGNINPLFF